MRRIFTTILLLAMALPFVMAEKVNESQNFPARPSIDSLVIDFAQILTPENRTTLETQLSQFKGETGVELIVVTINYLEGMKSDDFIQKIMSAWQIGGENENGIVLLMRPLQKNAGSLANILVGTNVISQLPQSSATKILYERVIPDLNKKDHFAAISKGVREVIHSIDIPAEEKVIKSDKFTTKEWTIFGAIAVILIGIVVYMTRHNRKSGEEYRRDKAERKQREQDKK